jgi:hypothetical protein
MDLIIPIKRKEPFDDPAYLFELKLDGFRGLADTIQGDALEERQPDEVVQRRLHRQGTTGG